MEANVQQFTRRLSADGNRAISSARSRLDSLPWFNTLLGQKPHILELSLVIGAYLVYMLTRGLIYSDLDGKGLQNADRIISAEKSLGIFWEPGWQSWLLDNLEGLVLFFNWTYIFTYWPIIIVVGLALYIMNRPRYYYYRTVVTINLVFALLIFMLFPVASPFDFSGFVNSIQSLGPSLYGSSEMAGYYNTNAAMPSLHFSWTVILGVVFIRTFKGWFKLLGVAYPVMTFFAITITGNHFILDAVAGGALAAAAFAVMELGFRRPLLQRGYTWARVSAMSSWGQSQAVINGLRNWEGTRDRALALYEQKRSQGREWLVSNRERTWERTRTRVLALYEQKRSQGREWLVSQRERAWERTRTRVLAPYEQKRSQGREWLVSNRERAWGTLTGPLFQKSAGWSNTWILRIKPHLVMFLRRYLSPRKTVTR